MTKPKKRKKQNVGPTLVVDRRIRGIPRIRHATGLTSEPQFRKLNDEITAASKTDEGRALLRMMAGKHPKLRADVFFRAANTKTLHLIPQGNAALPLVDALTQWREDTKPDVSTDTYRVRGELVRWVEALAEPSAMVATLPDVIRQLRVRQAKAARSFNLNRAYALAFVRDTLGKLSPVYLGIQAVTVRKVRPKVKPRPLTPAELLELRAGFDKVAAEWLTTHTSPKATKKPIASWKDAFAMALTGMNPKEYHGEWSVREDRVHIGGTKRPGRMRDVPVPWPSALWMTDGLYSPSASQKVYAKAFRAAADAVGLPCTPYDLRRSFANWMEAAGIPRTRRFLYMGHGAKDITDLYERHEVASHLAADGVKLRTWIDRQLAPNSPVSPESSPDAIQ
jgi:integrase